MRRRAFTLVEVLVGVAVFCLLIGVIGAVSMLVHRYSRQAHQVSQAQREAVSCMRAVAAEVARARFDSWATDGGEGYWFLSNRGPESETVAPTFDPTTGQVLWRQWVGLWRDAGGEVRRAEIPLPGAGQPLLLVDWSTTPAGLATFTTLPRRRILARRITGFSMLVSGRECRAEIESTTSNGGNPRTRYFIASSFILQ